MHYTTRRTERESERWASKSAGTADKAVYFFARPVKYPDAPSPVNNMSKSYATAMVFIEQISARAATCAVLFHILRGII